MATDNHLATLISRVALHKILIYIHNAHAQNGIERLPFLTSYIDRNSFDRKLPLTSKNGYNYFFADLKFSRHFSEHAQCIFLNIFVIQILIVLHIKWHFRLTEDFCFEILIDTQCSCLKYSPNFFEE